jgi:hypothetical protein
MSLTTIPVAAVSCRPAEEWSMRKIIVLAIALLTFATLGLAQQTGVFSRTDEACGGELRALTARIDSPGHKSAETICYLDEDDSGSFTPARDTFLGVNHDNEITGCAACAF